MDIEFYDVVTVEMKAENDENQVDDDLTELIELNETELPNNSNQMDTSVSRELSKEDEADEKAINNMFGTDEKPVEPCCSSNCNSKIPKELAIKHRYAFQELDKKEKDLVILSHLQQHRRISSLIKEYAKSSERKTSRLKSKDTLTRQLIHYYFCDLQICQKMYFFLHDVSKNQFKNLINHYDEQGLTPRVHKLKSIPPKRDNILSAEDTEHIVTFIKSYSERFGRFMPRRTAKVNIPRFKNHTVIGLPANMSKSALYNKYCESGGKQIALKTFYNVWNMYCPYIISLHRQATNTNTSKQNAGENLQ